jgi:hypothetical protein
MTSSFSVTEALKKEKWYTVCSFSEILNKVEEFYYNNFNNLIINAINLICLPKNPAEYHLFILRTGVKHCAK